MKRLLIVAAVAAGVVGMAMVADAAVDRLNTCTSTYELTGQGVSTSGEDTAIVRVQTPPDIVVAKWAENQRTGIKNADQVSAVSGDTIEFHIYWYNNGDATADTVVLSDGVPTGLSFDALTAGDSITNGNKVSYTESGGLVQYIATACQGIDAAQSSGEFKFTATVN
jgi:uncharacterized repeat protein (TIGR01451 family)